MTLETTGLAEFSPDFFLRTWVKIVTMGVLLGERGDEETFSPK